jgi:type I restriction enzyme S subunit
MVRFFRAKAGKLTERIDPNYYDPKYEDNEQKIKRNGIALLSDFYSSSGIGNTSGVAQHYEDSNTSIPYVSGKAIKSFSLNFDNCETISLDAHNNELKKAKLKHGDVLVIRKGDVGNTCVVPASIEEANCSSEVIYLSFPSVEQSYFVAAYLNSVHGSLAFKRLSRGTIIPGVSLFDVPNLPVLDINEIAQSYIGNKVRQAELLREWGKILETLAGNLFDSLTKELGYIKKESVKTGWATLDSRLDPVYYDKQYGFFDDGWFVKNSSKLSEFIVEGSYGVLPSSNSYGTGGCRLVTATNIVESNYNSRLYTLVPKDEVNTKARVYAGQILMEIKGGINYCVVASELLDGTYVNGSVYRFSTTNIDVYYLAYYLNSKFKNLYCDRVSVNNIIKYLDQESIHSLPVLRLKGDSESKISAWYQSIQKAKRLTFELTQTAKYLVEALIEGQITEAELIAAQQALEEGDNSKDRTILSKLTDKGYLAEEGKKLFPDLDKLYELLDEAQQAKGAEAEQGASA